MIVASIQNVVEPNEDFWYLREIEFKVPGVQDAPPKSQANLFLSALEKEILPLVETAYRANPAERILYGYSSSGFLRFTHCWACPDCSVRISPVAPTPT